VATRAVAAATMTAAAVPRARAITVATVVVTMIGEAAVTKIVATVTAAATPRERLCRSHHTVAVDHRHQGASSPQRLQGTALATAVVVVAMVIAVAVAVAMLRTAAATLVVRGILGVTLVDMAARLLRPLHLAEEVVATTPQRRLRHPIVAAAHMVALRSAATHHHRPCHRQNTRGWKAEGLLPRAAPTPVMVGKAVEVIGGDGSGRLHLPGN